MAYKDGKIAYSTQSFGVIGAKKGISRSLGAGHSATMAPRFRTIDTIGSPFDTSPKKRVARRQFSFHNLEERP
jgi:hypothetical protein